MSVNGIKGEGEKPSVLSSQPSDLRTIRPRVTFKKNCKGDFITINVSGRRFEADNSIFKRHPGKSSLLLRSNTVSVEPVQFCNFFYALLG